MKIPIKLKVILFFPLLYVIYLTAMFFVQDFLVFPGTSISCRDADYSEVTTIDIHSDEGISKAYYFDAVIDGNFENPFVIYAHGNGEIAQDNFRIFDQYRDVNCDVIIVEYPGYGCSEGSPSEESINVVFEKAYDYALKLSETGERKVLAHGVSVGGGVVCKLSESRKIDAMVLQCTFTSLKSMASGYLLPEFMIRNQYENDRVLTGSTMPLLIYHGTRDRMIPFKHAVRLDSVAKNSRLISLERGHGGWFGLNENTSQFVRENLLLAEED